MMKWVGIKGYNKRLVRKRQSGNTAQHILEVKIQGELNRPQSHRFCNVQ